MQRLFSTFPAGAPGVGLLLLRISVAAFLLLNVYDLSVGKSYAVFAVVLLLVLSVSLLLGLLTPLVALFALALQVLCAASGENSHVGHFAAALEALALALLGPGSYSLDAFRFGRRRVVLGPNARPPE